MTLGGACLFWGEVFSQKAERGSLVPRPLPLIKSRVGPGERVWQKPSQPYLRARMRVIISRCEEKYVW